MANMSRQASGGNLAEASLGRQSGNNLGRQASDDKIVHEPEVRRARVGKGGKPGGRQQDIRPLRHRRYSRLEINASRLALGHLLLEI